MLILLSVLVALVGVLMYALSGNPKLVEIGKIMFAVGLFVFLECTCRGNSLLGIMPR